MKHPNRWYWLVAVVILLCTFFVVFSFYAVGNHESTQREMLKEVLKAFLQLGTLGTLGALVKYAIDQMAASREERLAARAFQSDLLLRLRKVHQTVRSLPFLIEQEASADAYHKYMRDLLEARVQLTDIGNDLKTSNLPRLKALNVEAQMSRMTIYLSDLLRESVEARATTWEEVKKLPRYAVYRNGTLRFQSSKEPEDKHSRDYDDHYEAAKDKLREAIMEINQPEVTG